jgi:hypothetical protein
VKRSEKRLFRFTLKRNEKIRSETKRKNAWLEAKIFFAKTAHSDLYGKAKKASENLLVQ